MTIIDDVILKVDVDEYIEYYGDYLKQNILVWSKTFTGLDINSLRNSEWKKKHSNLK